MFFASYERVHLLVYNFENSISFGIVKLVHARILFCIYNKQ